MDKTNSNISVLSKVLWLALVISPLTIFLVGQFVVFPTIDHTGSPDKIWVFMGIALVLAIVAKVIHIKANSFSDNNKEQNALIMYVLSWALGDSIAVLGLITPILVGMNAIDYSYSFFVAAILINIIHKPNL